MSTPTSDPPKRLATRGLFAVAMLFVIGCIEIFGGGFLAGMGAFFAVVQTVSPTRGEFHQLGEAMRNAGAVLFMSVGPVV